MRLLAILMAGTVFLSVKSETIAQSLDEDTKCGMIETIVYAPAPDKREVQQILNYTLETMQAIDRLHRLRGQTAIFPQMTDEGRTALALVVANRCRSHAGLTLADTAIEIYEAIRTMRTSLALNGPRRKWARRTLTHRVPPVTMRLGMQPPVESIRDGL